MLVKLDSDSYRLADMMGNARSYAAPLGLARLELTQNPVYLEGSRVVAEIEQPLTVEPGVVLKPGEARTVQLTIRNPVDAAASGVCTIGVPDGWQVEPRQVKISGRQRCQEPFVQSTRRAGSGQMVPDTFVSADMQAFPLKITAPDHLRRGRASLTCRLQLKEKGDGGHLCEAPEGPYRQMPPVPFFLDLDGLDAGSVLLAAPITSQPTTIDLDGDVAEWQSTTRNAVVRRGGHFRREHLRPRWPILACCRQTGLVRGG